MRRRCNTQSQPRSSCRRRAAARGPSSSVGGRSAGGGGAGKGGGASRARRWLAPARVARPTGGGPDRPTARALGAQVRSLSPFLSRTTGRGHSKTLGALASDPGAPMKRLERAVGWHRTAASTSSRTSRRVAAATSTRWATTPSCGRAACTSRAASSTEGANPKGAPHAGFRLWINLPAAMKMDEPFYGTVQPRRSRRVVRARRGPHAILAGRGGVPRERRRGARQAVEGGVGCECWPSACAAARALGAPAGLRAGLAASAGRARALAARAPSAPSASRVLHADSRGWRSKAFVDRDDFAIIDLELPATRPRGWTARSARAAPEKLEHVVAYAYRGQARGALSAAAGGEQFEEAVAVQSNSDAVAAQAALRVGRAAAAVLLPLQATKALASACCCLPGRRSTACRGAAGRDECAAGDSQGVPGCGGAATSERPRSL